MNEKLLEGFLKDFTYKSKYEVLEEAADESLQAILDRKGITYPCHDLAAFKCRFAFTDVENANGCTLPDSEITEDVLKTLSGKAIDFDHIQEKTVGYWLEAEKANNEIYAYGMFFKSHLKDDYAEIKELMNEGNLKISMEAWGTREFKAEGGYNLNNVEFAGGALLINTKPAFGDKTEVLELAKSNRVLELAKTMKEPDSFILNKEQASKRKDKASSIYDLEFIRSLIAETKPPTKEDSNWDFEILGIDFENNKAKVKYYMSGTEVEVNFMPKSKILKKGKVVAKTIKKLEVMRMEELVALLKESASEEQVKVFDQILAKYEELNTELASKAKDLEEKSSELASSQEVVEELKKESEEAKAKIEAMEADISEKVAKAKEEATKIAEIKAELGEFAKDMLDEDLLNEDKVEIAKLRKELAKKESVKEEASMEAGSNVKEKEEASKQDTDFDVRSRVQALAYRD